MSGERVQRTGPSPHRLRLADKDLQLAVLGAALVALSVCLLVDPDEQGIGTHSRLGLPRCGYLARHGVPCPTCGATTSVCELVRGRPTVALRTHFGGFVVGCMLALSIPFSLASILLGWPWLIRLRKIPLHGWTAVVCVFLALFLVGWPHRVERYCRSQSHAVSRSFTVEDVCAIDAGGASADARHPPGIR